RTPSCIAPSRSIRSASSTTLTRGSATCGRARRSQTCSRVRVICRSRRFALRLEQGSPLQGDETDHGPLIELRRSRASVAELVVPVGTRWPEMDLEALLGTQDLDHSTRAPHWACSLV